MRPLRDIERAVAEAVICAFKGDHSRLARRQQRGLERRLHRLEPRIAENCLACGCRRAPPVDFGLWTLDFGLPQPSFERDPTQLPRQPSLKHVRVHVAHRMEQSAHLPLPGLDYTRVGVPGRRHAEGGGQVQILLPLRIPNMHARGPFPNDGPRAIRLNERHIARFVGPEQPQCLANGHSAETTDEPRCAQIGKASPARRFGHLCPSVFICG